MKIVLIGGPRHREEYDTVSEHPTIADYSRKVWNVGARRGAPAPVECTYYIHRTLGEASASDSISKHIRQEPEPIPPRH